MSAHTSRATSRVVVTGMGIVSCLGNTLDDVSAALREGRSGLSRIDAWRARGFGSQVAGVASVAGALPFDRKLERFMGDTARFACHAARSAIADAELDPATLRSPQAGAVIGSGVGTMSTYDHAMAIAHTRGVDKVPPYTVPQAMSSTASANVAQAFGLEGVSYSPSSACTTSALAIGQAMQLIQTGRQQIVLAGGSESLHDNMTLMFDAMGALSRHFNDTPQRASRPYDTARDGFVIASGGGVLVLEALDHALARGARIYAELTGFGEGTDGAGMVTPHAPGIARAMRAALDEGGVRPGYINTHGPSTPLGDIEELRALADVFGPEVPPFSSTKGLTGHPLGACGAHEAIYTLLMMRDGFIAGTTGIETIDPRVGHLPLVQASRAAQIDAAMSVSFGFGGSCASLMFRAWKGA
ncbi:MULTISPECIES: beta-ketoacyl synthase [Paraburkholderia]|uniref:3-oxoacyl-[acyl-carrier-protein] synthase 1 n=1 Tax=Paraburkholderia megapolitana TaxID=420953 RepID=A0A1I3J585_9BURK|nr:MULTISPECIES: beta-ketoacyl synthase N-terminal-like domain-containing protein [Paraburkholderia]MCX4160838.1 beta-ketoacyl synthase N-terminal-like domain-containing protein [Paraburkholderia megapolitana]MDN7156335.1 beta-ketoacyl-ACP synthase I [Paraburkholderia sp. CHISQ3]MDQ6493380.1 beta-ketoacyl-ACP synthase I [Paraburkholderia megapolitana]QDQ84925.1 beta-ketoacyl-ACP synthase I [Paraburkholderia megapolitana]SFI55432.1 3-oxoacyl-[acyl-carrier-protein] synthase-1 [Paraburkholderia m